MPTYEVTDPKSGRVLELTGDTPPTEIELDGLFSQYKDAPSPESLWNKTKEIASKTLSDVGLAASQDTKTQSEGAVAAAETLGTVASGATSWVPAGLSMLSADTRSLPERAKTAQDIQEAFTYEPKTEAGKKLTEIAMTPLTAVSDKFEEGALYSEKKYKEALESGDQESADRWNAMIGAARFGKDSWMFALPLVFKGIKGAKNVVKESITPPKGMEGMIPEQGKPYSITPDVPKEPLKITPKEEIKPSTTKAQEVAPVAEVKPTEIVEPAPISQEKVGYVEGKQPIIPQYKTENTKTSFDIGRTTDTFEIKTKDGSTINGYLKNQDFPGEVSKPERGELFLTNVVEGQKGKGVGQSLNDDAIRLMYSNGAKTVNLHATSPGGEAIVKNLIKHKYISEPIKTSPSGKTEHIIFPEKDTTTILNKAQEGKVAEVPRDIQYQIDYAKKYGIRKLGIGELTKEGDIGYAQPGAKEFTPRVGLEFDNNMHPIYRKIAKEDVEPFYLKSQEAPKVIETKINEPIKEPVKPIEETVAEPIKPIIEEKQKIETPENFELKSRVYERLKKEYPEILTEDVTYEKSTRKAGIDKALELVERDPKEAFKVAIEATNVPEVDAVYTNGIMAEKARKDGNNDLYRRLVKQRTLAQTRRGQAVEAEKAFVTDNDVSKYVKELISTRLDNLGKNYLDTVKGDLVKKSNKTKGIEAIDKQVSKAQAKMSDKMLDIREAQSLIDRLTCK